MTVLLTYVSGSLWHTYKGLTFKFAPESYHTCQQQVKFEIHSLKHDSILSNKRTCSPPGNPDFRGTVKTETGSASLFPCFVEPNRMHATPRDTGELKFHFAFGWDGISSVCPRWLPYPIGRSDWQLY